MNKEILKEIERLISAFGSSRDTASREVLLNLCEIAANHPLTLVSRVVGKFIRGEIPGQSLEFPPKPPQFAAALRGEGMTVEEQEHFRAYLRSTSAPIQRRETPKAIEHSPASMERVGELLSKFKRGEPVRP